MYALVVLGLLVSFPTQSGAIRQGIVQSAETEEADVCCCRHEVKGHEKCSGNLETGGRRYFYEAVTPSRRGPDDAGSHTCYEKPLCCHTFKGSCQMSAFGLKERYSLANVDPTLCTALPEVAESMFTATPEELFGDEAFLGALTGHVNHQKGYMKRDYTIVIDRSGSMSIADQVTVPQGMADLVAKSAWSQKVRRWEQVRMAIDYLAPLIVEEDPDGVSIFFFDNGWDEHENVRTVREIDELFAENSPGGKTYLAEALTKAMEPDTIGRAETIFVITDGAASDPQAVTRAIIEKSQVLCRPELLSISFIQVGNDASAGAYLKHLDDDLESQNARFDIVDAMSQDEMDGKNFLEVVYNSIAD